MITHSVPAQVQWHARSCCLNDGYLSAADSIALLQNLSCLCCYSPNKTCWRFHTAALTTTVTSSPIVPAGLYDSRLYDFCYSLDLLKSPVLLWVPLKPSSFLIHLVNGIGQLVPWYVLSLKSRDFRALKHSSTLPPFLC